MKAFTALEYLKYDSICSVIVFTVCQYDTVAAFLIWLIDCFLLANCAHTRNDKLFVLLGKVFNDLI